MGWGWALDSGGWRQPVQDAPRRHRLTGLQRPPVDRQLHDAAHKVVGGDLAAAVEEGLNGADAPHREPVGLNVEDPARTQNKQGAFNVERHRSNPSDDHQRSF